MKPEYLLAVNRGCIPIYRLKNNSSYRYFLSVSDLYMLPFYILDENSNSFYYRDKTIASPINRKERRLVVTYDF